MSTNTSTAAASLSRRSLLGLVTSMALIEALSGVTQGYLNPILPALGPDLMIDDPTINGIFLISNVSFAVMTPIISRLGDNWGCRAVLRASAIAVAIGAVLMAAIPSLVTITIGVVLLTLVVGFIPLMMGILRFTSPENTRTGVGAMIGSLMLTVGVGGLLAGVVGATQPLRGLWVAVPFAVIAVVCSFLLPKGGPATREPIAFLPMAACSLGLIGVVTALSMGPVWGWFDFRTASFGITGLVLLVMWIRRDLNKTAKRFVDLRVLTVPRVRVVTIATFFFGFASISYFGTNGIVLHANPAVAGYGFDLGPFEIAWMLAAGSVVALATSLSTPRLMSWAGERAVLIIAAAVLAAGFATMGLGHGTFTGYATGFALFNAGLGIYQASTRTLSVEGVPVEETSTAAGINELALSVGAAVGAAFVKLLSSANVEAGKISISGVTGIWILLGCAAIIAGAAAVRYPQRMKVKTP